MALPRRAAARRGRFDGAVVADHTRSQRAQRRRDAELGVLRPEALLQPARPGAAAESWRVPTTLAGFAAPAGGAEEESPWDRRTGERLLGSRRRQGAGGLTRRRGDSQTALSRFGARSHHRGGQWWTWSHPSNRAEPRTPVRTEVRPAVRALVRRVEVRAAERRPAALAHLAAGRVDVIAPRRAPARRRPSAPITPWPRRRGRDGRRAVAGRGRARRLVDERHDVGEQRARGEGPSREPRAQRRDDERRGRARARRTVGRVHRDRDHRAPGPVHAAGHAARVPASSSTATARS